MILLKIYFLSQNKYSIWLKILLNWKMFIEMSIRGHIGLKKQNMKARRSKAIFDRKYSTDCEVF